VVSTSIGAEGLGASPDVLRLADDAEAFAAEVVALVRDPERRLAMVERARRFTEESYDWPAIAERLFAAYGWNGHPADSLDA
jgi:glycosyltransferase involved in cell wall biosynthesis